MPETGLVKHLRMGREYLTHGPAGLDRGLAGFERVAGDAVHAALGGGGLADDQSLHHGCVIARIGARPFKCQLILRIKMAATGGVAAKQGALGGANDKLIARIIAASTKYRALHIGQNISLKGAGAGAGQCRVQGIIRKGRCPAVHVQFRRGLILSQIRDNPIAALQALVKSGNDGLPIGEGQTGGFGLYCDFTAIAQGFDQICQSAGWRYAFDIFPNVDLRITEG